MSCFVGHWTNGNALAKRHKLRSAQIGLNRTKVGNVGSTIYQFLFISYSRPLKCYCFVIKLLLIFKKILKSSMRNLKPNTMRNLNRTKPTKHWWHRRQFTLMLVSFTPKTLPSDGLAGPRDTCSFPIILTFRATAIHKFLYVHGKRAIKDQRDSSYALLLDLLSCHVHVRPVLVHLIYVRCVWRVFRDIQIHFHKNPGDAVRSWL